MFGKVIVTFGKVIVMCGKVLVMYGKVIVMSHLPHYIEACDKIFYRSKPILDQLKLYWKWYSTGRRLLFIASDVGWCQNSVSRLLLVISLA